MKNTLPVEFTLPEPVGTLISDPYEGHVFVPTNDAWPFSQPLFTEDQLIETLQKYKEFLDQKKA